MRMVEVQAGQYKLFYIVNEKTFWGTDFFLTEKCRSRDRYSRRVLRYRIKPSLFGGAVNKVLASLSNRFSKFRGFPLQRMLKTLQEQTSGGVLPGGLQLY